MTIHEPMTMATDYALALGTAILGVMAWRRGARMWALMFFFTAAGSFFGGTYHATAQALWWKPTVYAIGLASFFLLLGASANRIIQIVALAEFMVYATWMIGHDSFLWVIVDYGIALLIVVCLQIYAWIAHRATSAPWIVGGVVTSVIAAVVQQAPFPAHNDVYHVIQLFAMWLLYRGAISGRGNVLAGAPIPSS